MTAPVYFTWDGDSMAPLPRFAKLCDRQYVVGETYRLIEDQERSQATHNHFFAAVEECWKNLPEDIAHEFLTSEHLRKHALIRCGYADKRSFACGSRAEALRLAAFLKPMDEYAIVDVREATVIVYIAQSQKKRAMGAKAFQESKERVLIYISGLIDVAPETLSANAGRAA